MIKVQEFATEGYKVIGQYQGFVRFRNDPEGKARIRAEIPGMVTLTTWIRPYCILDGSNGRGIFCVPKEEANIMVLWIQCDGTKQSYIRYVAGPWGARDKIPEVPSESEGGDPDIFVLALDGFALVVDEREGQRKMTLLDREENGSYIQFDIEQGDIFINAKRDADKRVARDDLETIQGDQSTSVTGDKSTVVGGNLTITVNGNADIDVTGAAEVKAGGTMLIDGEPEIKLGQGATDNLIKKIPMQTWAAAHKHVGVQPGSGVSGISDTPLPDAAATTKTKGE